MFKSKPTSSDDIFLEMYKNLSRNYTVRSNEDRLLQVKAVNYLISAADKFKKSGMVKVSDVIERIAQIASTEEIEVLPEIKKPEEIKIKVTASVEVEEEELLGDIIIEEDNSTDINLSKLWR